jgi:hypothetical protein
MANGVVLTAECNILNEWDIIWGDILTVAQFHFLWCFSCLSILTFWKWRMYCFWPNIVNIESSTHFTVYSHTHRYLRAPWSRILLENLIGSQLVKKFPSFYGTRRFITVFTNACRLSLSWARSIQSMPSHPTSRRSVLRFSSHLRLGLPSGLFPSGFPNRHTKPV